MRATLITLSACLFNLLGFSQAAPTNFLQKNIIQVEAFGHGLFYSVGYERVLINHQTFKTSALIGFAYYPPQSGIIDWWIPLVINELVSIHNHHLELGIGTVITREATRNADLEALTWLSEPFLTGRLGYRWQRPQGRWLFKIAFTPLMKFKSIIEFHPLGGLAGGYTF